MIHVYFFPLVLCVTQSSCSVQVLVSVFSKFFGLRLKYPSSAVLLQEHVFLLAH